MDDEGFSVQGQAGCWGKLAFSSAVKKGACRDVGRMVSEPQPEDFPGTGNREKVCCGGVPSSDSYCHSCASWASDIRMKMEWKAMSKTEKSKGLVFPECRGYVGWWYSRCLRVLWTGSGRGLTALRGHSVGDSLWFLVLLFIFVWAGPSYRVEYWRAVLATASRCVEGYRTPGEAMVC